MLVGISVLSCFGHIFKFDFDSLLAEFIMGVTSQCACTHLCFYLDHFGTAMKAWDVLHLMVVAYFRNGSHMVRP